MISVVIPVYNGEKTIRETIESVFKQTFSDFELLVINDGSTDSTKEIVSSITDPRLQLFSYPNAGQPATRNRGISLAKGNYISFLDADDLWTPEKLESQYQALQQHPQAALAYSLTDYIDNSGKLLNQGCHLIANGDVLGQLLLTDFIGSGSNPLIRKDTFTEVGEFDTSLTNAHDWDMWLRLANRYHFVAVPTTQILYRRSPNSMSTNIKGMANSSAIVLKKAFAQAPQSVQHLKRTSFANRYKSLTFQALQKGNLGKKRAWIAAKCIFGATTNDLSLLTKPIFWKVCLKIAIVMLLPSQSALNIISKLKPLSNLHALMFLQQLEPS